MALVDEKRCALADLCRFGGISLAAGAETQLSAACMLHHQAPHSSRCVFLHVSGKRVTSPSSFSENDVDRTGLSMDMTELPRGIDGTTVSLSQAYRLPVSSMTGVHTPLITSEATNQSPWQSHRRIHTNPGCHRLPREAVRRCISRAHRARAECGEIDSRLENRRGAIRGRCRLHLHPSFPSLAPSPHTTNGSEKAGL